MSIVDDATLERLTAYLDATTELKLCGTLGPQDWKDVVIRAWSDSDWAGDSVSTKSTSGCWVELAAEGSGNTFPLTWYCTWQTHTASSSAEAEIVAASGALRREALPIQQLIESCTGRRLQIEMMVDNTQAIAAAERGYSKKLRHLNRTHRVAIGVIHECLMDKEMAVSMTWVPTATPKGDLFTKALLPANFLAARDRLGLKASSRASAD